MNKDTFLEKITEIGTCEDDVARRTMLAEVREEVSKIYDSNDELTTSNKKFEEDNEALRKANMELFVMSGSEKNDKQKQEDQLGIKDDEKPKRKFEDLFKKEGDGK